jgi:hypothetical protein
MTCCCIKYSTNDEGKTSNVGRRCSCTYAGLLEKAGRQREADSAMKLAFPKGNVEDLYSYGSKLLRMKKNKAAFDVFKMDDDKAPPKWLTNFGLAKGYAVVGLSHSDPKLLTGLANAALIACQLTVNRQMTRLASMVIANTHILSPV